jgi:hypothetical protein
MLGKFDLFLSPNFVFEISENSKQYSKQQACYLLTLKLSFTISTSLSSSLVTAVSVCTCIREMPVLLSARFHHISQSNGFIILQWRQHRLLPIPFRVSSSDHPALNTAPSTVLTPSQTIPQNEAWEQNYLRQAILGPLMSTVFVDEMVSCFVKYSCVKAEILPTLFFFGNYVY